MPSIFLPDKNRKLDIPKTCFFLYNLLYTSLINLISTNILPVYICWCLDLAIKIRSISLIWNTWVTKIVHETLYHILLSKDIIFVLTNNQTIFLYDVSSKFSDTLTHLAWWQFCSIGVSLYKTFESHTHTYIYKHTYIHIYNSPSFTQPSSTPTKLR